MKRSLLALSVITLLGASPAHAQSSLSSAADLSSGLGQSLSSGSLSSVTSSALSSEEMNANDALKRLHEEWSYNEPSSRAGLRAMMSSLAMTESSSMIDGVIDKLWVRTNPGWPKPIDGSITQAEVVEVVPSRYDDVERWMVASPANGRIIPVDVYSPGTSTQPRPVVYMYEGVDGPNPSAWLQNGKAKELFYDEDVYVVMVGEDYAHFYADWVNDDPALGRNKMDTFRTVELPSIIESRLNTNGKRAAMGLSMGASGAIMTANRHPGFYNGVVAISGCYSTLDEIGRQTASLTVGSRGGDVENMWGPFGSEEWVRNDVIANPEGLRGTTLYFGAASGAIDDGIGRLTYKKGTVLDQSNGSLLEVGARECTENMEASLKAANIPATFEYHETGAHAWSTFLKFAEPGWETIKPALF
ncbi:MAG: alpha/beta hydrolase family protein [Corynebacterium sp.]|nr:alpha/beta hydrolase family protein [Corynebacterium sp.]